jgi:hypothetical protein
MRIDLSRAKQREDGTYQLPNLLRETEDGSIELINGKRLSKKEAVSRLIQSGDARGPDGRRIDPNNVSVGEDGVVRNQGGAAINSPSARERPEAGGRPARQREGTAGAPVGIAAGREEPSGAEAPSGTDRESTATMPVRYPRSAVGGIELISGGSGKNGVAAIGHIPVLK